jgi:hypothetical protein
MFDRVLVVALTQAEQALSLIGAIIPTIKPFLYDFNTRAHLTRLQAQEGATGIQLATLHTTESTCPITRESAITSPDGSEENMMSA